MKVAVAIVRVLVTAWVLSKIPPLIVGEVSVRPAIVVVVEPEATLVDPKVIGKPLVLEQTPATQLIDVPSPFMPPIAALVASGRMEGVSRPPAVVSTIVELPVKPKGVLDVTVVEVAATGSCPTVIPERPPPPPPAAGPHWLKVLL